MWPKRFIIRRNDHYELTSVGIDGTTNVHTDYPLTNPPPRGEFFTSEGNYRRAIEAAQAEAPRRTR